MIEIILAVTAVLVLVLGIAVGWLLRVRGRLTRQLGDADQRHDALRQATGRFETDLAVARSTQQNLEDQLRHARLQLETTAQQQRDELR